MGISAITIPNVFGFEPELYEGFFIEYGKCNVTIDADSELVRIQFSKIINEWVKNSFCVLLENSRFEYSHMTSNEVWTDKIKYGKEEPVRFFTEGDDERLEVILGKSWNQGDPLLQSPIANIKKLNYLGLGEKEINGKILDVHEFGAIDYFDDDSGTVGEVEVKSQYDVKSGFLISTQYYISYANALFGGGLGILNFEANDISEKPLLANILDTKSAKGGGCLIATATFGSELAPQVQQLRELRDNNLLQTKSGSAFMSGFNQFYYSFSPTIADWERQNPVFKEAVKLTITPLLSSLSILNYVDMDSEAEVLGYGISLIVLNIGMYLVAPVGIVVLVRRKI